MRPPFFLLAIIATACAPETSLQGRYLHVLPAPDGEVDDPMAIDKGPFTTIQGAIDAAVSGDTVVVPSGTYTENLVMKDGVTVKGSGQDQTYLVGSVTFTSLSSGTLSSMSLVDTAYNSTGTRYTYDGILVQSGAATLDDLGLYYYRYGIYALGATTVVVNNVTAARNWYGIYSTLTADFTLTNSLIANNPAAGVATYMNSASTIVHNTFVGNAFSGTAAYLTGAVALGSTTAEVVANNIITSNYYGIDCYECGGTWHHNLIWGNTTAYVNDASADPTDISGDPLFVNSSEGNYHLSAASPALDAGDATILLTTDMDGEVRPQGLGPDLGIDEFTVSGYDLVLTEVMANPKTEATGEFVEIYNAGATGVDLAGLLLTDRDDTDALQSYKSGTTILAAGAYAVVVDADYTGTYSIDPSITVVTTTDTNLGNGLTTSDKVTLYESDGSTIVATFTYPKDPGDGVSMEMVDLTTGDVAGNWRGSQCATGSSPGAVHCFPESGDPADLVITEVMLNAASESTGEYVELYNPTEREIDLAGLILRDSTSTDTLQAFLSGTTLLPPYTHAVIVDSGYSFDYYLPTDVILVTTADATLGNGLSTTDTVTLYLADGTTVIDSFTAASDYGDAVSIEKIDYAGGDVRTNWQAATTGCARGSSPARLNGAAGGVCAPLIVNEVMSNPLNEDTGEFVEIYNAGTATVDLAGLTLTDGDETDTIAAYKGGSTSLASGQYAIVVDSEYAGEYTVPAGAVVVTLTDSELGNALSVTDEIVLMERDGLHLIDAFLYPFNPGNGVSVERVAYGSLWDASTNWVASSCATGSSPGQGNCVSASSTGGTVSAWAGVLVITEIMSNPLNESTGEYVEIYNGGTTSIDLLRFILYDGDAVDTIFGFTDVYDTVLDPGQYALILDSDYASGYSLPSDALLLVTDDSTIGSGLSTNDPIYLYESDGSAIIDSYTSPFDAGNGISVEKVDLGAGDASTNWKKSTCATGSSPGQTSCF